MQLVGHMLCPSLFLTLVPYNCWVSLDFIHCYVFRSSALIEDGSFLSDLTHHVPPQRCLCFLYEVMYVIRKPGTTQDAMFDTIAVRWQCVDDTTRTDLAH